MRIPSPIYEILPYFYVIFGSVNIVYFYNEHSGVGMSSGVLFLLTAFLIGRLRYENRRYESTRIYWDKK